MFTSSIQKVNHVVGLEISFEIFPLLFIFEVLSLCGFIVFDNELVKRVEETVNLG